MAARIFKYAHKCKNAEYKLTAQPNPDPACTAFKYYLYCKKCKQMVGKLILFEGADVPTEVTTFCNIIFQEGNKKDGN